MNYRHIYHAGNFADVFKHIVLATLTKAFLRKDTPFCYLDTHAGIGRYDLHSIAAQKSKEYENGIQKVLSADNVPEVIQEYLSCVQQNQTEFCYPGSPQIVKHYLRAQDRMILCELHSEDYQTLKKNYSHNKGIAVHHQDAYQSLKAYLPPKEKRGLILIDPPFENTNEFTNITTALTTALKRFETGVYAIWYPIKNYAAIKKFHQQMKQHISRPMLICELSIYPDDVISGLNGSGMLIINPPFQVDEQLSDLLPWLWKVLSINQQGMQQIKFL